MSVLSTLPALAATLLVLVTVVLGSGPPDRHHYATLVGRELVMHDSAAELARYKPEMHTYAVPRVAANLEGDIAPILFVTGRTFDFPPFEPAPEPTQQAQVLVEPVRTPLPAISSVPHECPALIVEAFGANAPAACRVARCESSWRVDAVGAAGEVGVFQIHPVHFPHLYSTYGAAANLASMEINVAYAYSLSRGGSDWTHWSCRP